MPVSDKDHFDALRQADQRAVELLAKAEEVQAFKRRADWSTLIAIVAVLVAVAAIVLHR